MVKKKEGIMIELYEQDKTTLIKKVNPSEIEIKKVYSHGSSSDAMTLQKVNESQTDELYWKKFDDNKYYFHRAISCFNNGDAAAKFAVKAAVGT